MVFAHESGIRGGGVEGGGPDLEKSDVYRIYLKSSCEKRLVLVKVVKLNNFPTCLSSQRLALRAKSMEPPEMMPDFW